MDELATISRDLAGSLTTSAGGIAGTLEEAVFRLITKRWGMAQKLTCTIGARQLRILKPCPTPVWHL